MIDQGSMVSGRSGDNVQWMMSWTHQKAGCGYILYGKTSSLLLGEEKKQN